MTGETRKYIRNLVEWEDTNGYRAVDLIAEWRNADPADVDIDADGDVWCADHWLDDDDLAAFVTWHRAQMGATLVTDERKRADLIEQARVGGAEIDDNARVYQIGDEFGGIFAIEDADSYVFLECDGGLFVPDTREAWLAAFAARARIDGEQIKGRRLTPGQEYDLHKLTCIGWIGPDGICAHMTGYQVTHYFDECGEYLGPDVHGIEPIFE